VDNYSEKDVEFMRSALALARQGLGKVWPNPSVGCIIVKNGKVISRARTADSGRPHAETIAISMAGSECNSSDMYVTLEPCAHHGKTPPCCDAIVSSGVRRVVIACADTDQRTAGLGIEALKRAGINVQVGLLGDAAREINKGYFLNREKCRPMFTVKTATSVDAKIAATDGSSKWITGPLSRRFVHLERSCHDAILTGIGTVLADDPELTVRINGVHSIAPRIVIDTDLRLPAHSRLALTLDKGPVWVFTANDKKTEESQRLVNKGVDIFYVSKGTNGHCDLNEVARILCEKGLTRILVEAGSSLAGAFLKESLCDRLLWFRSAGLIGDDGLSALKGLGISSLDQRINLFRKEIRRLDEDYLEIYEPGA
jgi:diaminohydroxyphosphoribosylaminopyrimidine deaminase/5-amino-6-(5-phosphoribosylamino)uracil reductase